MKKNIFDDLDHISRDDRLCISSFKCRILTKIKKGYDLDRKDLVRVCVLFRALDKIKDVNYYENNNWVVARYKVEKEVSSLEDDVIMQEAKEGLEKIQSYNVSLKRKPK